MNLKTLFVLLLMFFVLHFSNGQRNKKFFRKDYKFIEATQSFYKIHTIPRPWLHAKRTCAQEGASLFYPEDDAEVQAVLEFWNTTQPFDTVSVGISDLVVKGIFETIDDGQRNKKFFRKDYKFIEATQSFYKIHTIPRPWLHAKRTCAQEGASLFYPEDDAEVQAVLEFWNTTQPFDTVSVGISDLVVKGIFETIDGTPVGDVYHSWSLGEPNDAHGNEDCVAFRKDGTYNDVPCSWKYPFICKKSLVSLEWNEKCNIPNLDYTFNEQLGRCYKFHLKPLNWTDAHGVCSAEQSYLAVIDTQQEADHLVAITNRAPKRQVTGAVVLLGFHDRLNDGWQTVRGIPIEDSGYSKWAPGQPDGRQRGVNARCGSMFYNGLLNDIQCDRAFYFICEHEVKKLSSAFDVRGGVEKR